MKILFAGVLCAGLALQSVVACEYYMREQEQLHARKIFSRAKTFPVASNGQIPNVARNKIFITIDDGPYGAATPAVLDVLHRYGVKATFFVVGKQAETYPQLVRRVYDEGHVIGSHTYEHGLDYSTPKDFLTSLLRTHRQIIPYQSTAEALLFRAPGGVWNDWRTTIANNNETMSEYVGAIYWNVGGGDPANRDDADWKCWSKANKVAPTQCAQSYLKQIRRNYSTRKSASIVLMHDINIKSAQMLEIILNDLTNDRSVDWEFGLVQEIPAVRNLM